ncbi:hypothetical protein CHCC20488_0354 [Bacillus paralicheniformis]|uniref:Uncharacterized protein n=1 Tax=Bacillus paralicheniformis TaxID=1648923 RepID=A0ABY3G1F9_9BACI|nr:hypothetical protein CHCC5021_1532 [Bacillus paralicheniformis]TWJ79253.1 hypothetical protein CHCC5019_0216 [Bacillus paralicheniformis]TWJ79466.1 hypothetical protein CHCC20497_4162 [Bacillus paralicheniformis]TWK51566.1 hypothetical protein CHCC20347_2866 [Bacillus paralicheniformis]TWL05494.1 hypothetical protein CHCC19468_4392 [Bacillus paralicheniformis]
MNGYQNALLLKNLIKVQKAEKEMKNADQMVCAFRVLWCVALIF